MTTDEMFVAAEALRKAGKNAEACEIYEQLLAVDEKHVLTHLTLAVVYGKLGEHDKAIAIARKVCEIDGDDSFNFTALSVTYKRAFDATQDPKYIQLAEDALAKGHGTGPH